MPTNASIPNHDASQGLPPVKPPSGRFIVQLFLIPGLIVAGLIFVFAFGSLSWVGASTPQAFLANLDNPNPDIRWRAAHELANVLKRPESLEMASDPDFALAIAERLRKANTELEAAEETTKKELFQTIKGLQANKGLSTEELARQEDEAEVAAWHKQQPQRDLVTVLIGSMGNFNIPVGVPVLGDIARTNSGAEIKGLSLRKRQAVWALANLGENINRHYFGKGAIENTKVLSDDQKNAILDKLAKAAQGEGERAATAKYAGGALQKLIPTGVDKILAECANHEDIFLREEVALALNFWDGDLVEPTLVRLAHDNGAGKLIVVSDVD